MTTQVAKHIEVQRVEIGSDGNYHVAVKKIPIYAIKLNKKNLCRPMGLRFNRKTKKHEEVPLCQNWKKAGFCSACAKIAKGGLGK